MVLDLTPGLGFQDPLLKPKTTEITEFFELRLATT